MNIWLIILISMTGGFIGIMVLTYICRLVLAMLSILFPNSFSRDIFPDISRDSGNNGDQSKIRVGRIYDLEYLNHCITERIKLFYRFFYYHVLHISNRKSARASEAGECLMIRKVASTGNNNKKLTKRGDKN